MRSALALILLVFIMLSCGDGVDSESRKKIKDINRKITLIDQNHRVQIVEDDFHLGDSIFKIRGYFMDDELVKLVSVLNTPTMERDDYFYFDNHVTMFAGHLYNERDKFHASEYRFYYENGVIFEALFWEDDYKRGQRFPHERFRAFNPNMDSLTRSEMERFNYFMSKLEMEGFEILHLNENLDAN